VTRSKNSAYCRVYHFNVLHFRRFFSLPRIKLVLKTCKVQKSNSLFHLHPLCRRRERAQKCIFSSWLCAKFPHLPNKIPFQNNKVNVQKHRNMKICCDLSHLSAQPIEEICLFFVMTVYNTRWKVLMQSRNNTIIHKVYQVC